MARLFVSAHGRLRERWSEAFPDARVAVDIAAVRPPRSAASASLWLDLTATKGLPVPQAVAAACATGWPVVAMTGVPGEAEAFAVMKAGARGYCHVKAAPHQLREIAMVVEHGGLWMPPDLLQRFLALSTRVIPSAPEPPGLNDLTSRELMVAQQVARGASNREIAQELEITERTVKAHISAIFDKLGVRDRVQLALKVNNIPTYSTIN